MADCSTQLALFPLARKPVVVRNDGGALTSDAGALLLREIDERLGLTARLAQCLQDRRQQAKVEHHLLCMLRQRIYQIACGYEDCNDADSLRQDPALKLPVGRSPQDADLASQPTLSRLENTVGWRECLRINEALVACYVERHRSNPPLPIVLDVDASEDETHGQQQLSFFHGYYDHHCYLPLLVFAQAEGKGEFGRYLPAQALPDGAKGETLTCIAPHHSRRKSAAHEHICRAAQRPKSLPGGLSYCCCRTVPRPVLSRSIPRGVQTGRNAPPTNPS